MSEKEKKNIESSNRIMEAGGCLVVWSVVYNTGSLSQ